MFESIYIGHRSGVGEGEAGLVPVCAEAKEDTLLFSTGVGDSWERACQQDGVCACVCVRVYVSVSACVRVCT